MLSKSNTNPEVPLPPVRAAKRPKNRLVDVLPPRVAPSFGLGIRHLQGATLGVAPKLRQGGLYQPPAGLGKLSRERLVEGTVGRQRKKTT